MGTVRFIELPREGVEPPQNFCVELERGEQIVSIETIRYPGPFSTYARVWITKPKLVNRDARGSEVLP